MTVDYDTEPTFAARWMDVLVEDPQVAELRDFNSRLAKQLADALALVAEKNARIAELTKAAADVLPTLELHWMGDRPIPEWHPTAALRKVLEEGK